MPRKLRVQYAGAIYHVMSRVPAAGDHDDAELDCRMLAHGDGR
jgi:hypothetical protein